MRQLPLVLSAKRELWREHDAASASADAEFSTVKRRVLERDNFTCQFCGFRWGRPERYMEVHHRNDDHQDNRLENLVTTCMHCHAVHHIGLWGAAEEAVIIYMPEWPQSFISHFCRAVLVARRSYDLAAAEPRPDEMKLRNAREISEVMTAMFDRVKGRMVEAEERIGTCSPSDLGNALLMAPPDRYAKRHEYLAPFRLLLLGHHVAGRSEGSTVDVMPGIVDGWMGDKGPYKSLPTSVWMTLLRDIG